jgi:hypothetical protein
VFHLVARVFQRLIQLAPQLRDALIQILLGLLPLRAAVRAQLAQLLLGIVEL